MHKYSNIRATYSDSEPDLRSNNVSEDRSGEGKSTYFQTSEQDIQNHIVVILTFDHELSGVTDMEELK